MSVCVCVCVHRWGLEGLFLVASDAIQLTAISLNH